MTSDTLGQCAPDRHLGRPRAATSSNSPRRLLRPTRKVRGYEASSQADSARVKQPEAFGSTNAGPVLMRVIEERIGVTAAVRVLPPGGIERSLDKVRRVVDRRPEE